ncbi:hypothetical protein A2U01_0108358, partial [Trifolium medium]|nr:hypothetical protein [Trifolium medium]
GFWEWPGPSSRAEPQFWACVVERGIVSLSEDARCSSPGTSKLFVWSRWGSLVLAERGGLN